MVIALSRLQLAQVIAWARIKLRFLSRFQSFTKILRNSQNQKLMLNFTWSQCEYLHIDGKMYMNIIRYKRELRFDCELRDQIRYACNCTSTRITLYFTYKSLESKLKHLKNVINHIYFMQRTLSSKESRLCNLFIFCSN